MASLWASFASFGNVAAERDAGEGGFDLAVGAAESRRGASIFGSNVSIWLAPPQRKRKMTSGL